MTRPSSLPATTHPLNDVFVLRGRPLRPGTALPDTPPFRDNKWPLRAALLQKHQYSLVLNFQTVPTRYRAVAKELCHAMLSAPLPPGETRLGVTTVHRVLAELVVFFTWLATRKPQPGRPAAPALQDLSGTDLQDYQRHLTVTTRTVGARHTRRAAVRYLWRYRSALTSDRLPFDPRHIEGWGEPRRNTPAENTTDRIPEQVHGPLLAWALRFVHDFAEDILAADQQWRAHHTPGRHAPVGSHDGQLRAALGQLLDDHVAHGRPLPGWRGTANLRFLADRLGCTRSALVRYQAHIDAAAERVGIGEWSYYDTPISATLDGKPWLEGIVTDHTANHGLAVLVRMLHVACYTTLAFLSGMRDCEIKHLRRGCLHIRHDDSGRPYRWQVTGLAFKGENDPSGVEATWTIGEPAARAVEILHRLQPPYVDLLFARLAHGPGNRRTDVNVSDALTSQATNKQLNWFADWINDYCDTHGRSDRIPLVNKRPWTLSSSQFRRTLAWFIARRPGGVIAGAIAYRHLSVQMFEGYAGTSESGFRAEVESELALARGEHLLAMIDAHQHDNLAGPAAEEATRRLQGFDEQARFRGTVITDERRLQRLMRRQDPAIYPGKYVTCVHNHATALCRQRRDSHALLRPDLGSCQPFACRNVALTVDNIRNLRHEIDNIDQELVAKPPLPPLLHHQLLDRRNEIATFVDRHAVANL